MLRNAERFVDDSICHEAADTVVDQRVHWLQPLLQPFPVESKAFHIKRHESKLHKDQNKHEHGDRDTLCQRAPLG